MKLKSKTKPQSQKPAPTTPHTVPVKAAPVPDSQRYADRVAQIGSVLIIADRLGVQPITIARRCNGAVPITVEAWLALDAVEYQRANPVAA